MEDNCFVLHGSVVFSRSKEELEEYKEAYLVCEDGLCAGVYEELPDRYKDFPVEDFWDNLIIPGLVDLHVHAPQYNYRGTGMDMELIDWLNKVTFPEEVKFRDRLYAERSYDMFVEDLYEGATTRAAVFATADVPSTVKLMDLLEDSGLVSFVGKVNMDRNVPDYYCETTQQSLEATKKWLHRIRGRYVNTFPILTPRFTPTCTDALMSGLAEIAEKENLPVQSHLSENPREIAWVKELEKDTEFYGQAYDKFGLFGGKHPAIMAHCVYSGEAETALMKKNGVFIAHCPASNTNLASGIAPVRRYLDMGMKVALGSDVAGGTETSVFKAMKDAVECSKLRWRLQDQSLAPLKLPEAFYMGTEAGGSFFGKVGSFKKGYEFDAVVLDDSNLQSMKEFTPAERLERLVYLSDERNVVGIYVRGWKLY